MLKFKSIYLCKYTVKCGFMQNGQKCLLVILHNEKDSEKISESFVKFGYVLIAKISVEAHCLEVNSKLSIEST